MPARETVIDAERLRSWIGRQEEARDTVTADLAARLHATLDLPGAPPARGEAVMFNAHRIHYDRPYATNVEGYPGLVVHGPLQAALLLNFAIEARGGGGPDQYVFQSRAPLFDNGLFTLNGDDRADGMELWTAAEGGPTATSAYARWS